MRNIAKPPHRHRSGYAEGASAWRRYPVAVGTGGLGIGVPPDNALPLGDGDEGAWRVYAIRVQALLVSYRNGIVGNVC
jgi:hypothetical protein